MMLRDMEAIESRRVRRRGKTQALVEERMEGPIRLLDMVEQPDFMRIPLGVAGRR